MIEGLAWPIKASFARYVAALPDGRAELTGGLAASPDWGLAFPLSDAAQFDRRLGEGVVRFGGAIQFRGHFGMLRLMIGEPWLRVANSHGILSIVSEGRERLDFARFRLRWDTDQAIGFGETVKLEPAGVPLFGGVYGEETALDGFRIQIGA